MAGVTRPSRSRKSSGSGCQGGIRIGRSADFAPHADHVAAAVGAAHVAKELAHMADLAYAVLLIGAFLALALMLRGLEKL